MSEFTLAQYIDLCTSSLVISTPMWLLCSYFNACCCNSFGMMILLPFIATPFTTARSTLSVHYGQISWRISLLLNYHLFMMISFSYCRCASISIAYWISQIDIHVGISVVVLISLMPSLMPGISSAFFSASFCHDNQPGVKSSWLDLYHVLVVYLFIHNYIHCNLCDKFATAFLKMATSGLWSVIILTALTKQ